MTVTTSARAPRSIDLPGDLTLTYRESGDRDARPGRAVLLLHGGAGPGSLAGFADALAEDHYVITPTHPGFAGTERPAHMDRVADLAVAYLDLLDALELTEVLVVGSSVGGWIAAETALRDTRRVVTGIVLVNAAGIAPEPGAGITDVAAVSPAELGRLAFHQARFRPDPATLTDAQRAAAAADRQTLAVYAGDPYMHDPKLRGRLHRVQVPALVVWGEQDGVIPLGYGRAFADALPDARFVTVPQAAHFPFLEQPALVLAALRDFVTTAVESDRTREERA